MLAAASVCRRRVGSIVPPPARFLPVLSAAAGALAPRSSCAAPAALLSHPSAGLGRRAMSTPAKVDDESHDDFKPKMKASPTDPAQLKKYIDDLVAKYPVVLFMKGTPQQPMCGFSMRAVQMLHANGADVHGVDVLSNPTIRQFMKEYSQWPTFPQLYVNGEFVGGCDIMTQLQQSGELASMLSHSKEAESKEDVN